MANKTLIQQYKNTQMMITIPKGIAQALRLRKGDEIEWVFDRGDVIFRKV